MIAEGQGATRAHQDQLAGQCLDVKLITSTTTRKGKHEIACHRFITSLRNTPDALLLLIRQRWNIGNEGHWVRDTQLSEDAQRFTNRTGATVISFLRTVMLNLLRRGDYRSLRKGFRELAYNIKRMLALGGVTTHRSTA
jgi:predicted transposase YbfD/YdcC